MEWDVCGLPVSAILEYTSTGKSCFSVDKYKLSFLCQSVMAASSLITFREIVFHCTQRTEQNKTQHLQARLRGRCTHIYNLWRKICVWMMGTLVGIYYLGYSYTLGKLYVALLPYKQFLRKAFIRHGVSLVLLPLEETGDCEVWLTWWVGTTNHRTNTGEQT